jgi:hypothetical protein
LAYYPDNKVGAERLLKVILLEEILAHLPILTPIELQLITNCTLQYHFWQQSPARKSDPLEQVVLETIQHLHAAGGPRRHNLPAILRYMEQLIAETGPQDESLTAGARQMVANYHRRLREEWPKIIASNELLTLKIRLKRAVIRCEGVINRLDREEDGGITAIKFVTVNQSETDFTLADNIEATIWHALTASAYPHRRPVRLTWRWLYQNQDQTLQLTEKEYRQNLEMMKGRLQAWLDGEILARPGLYCNRCPFKYQGCPIYLNADESPTESPPDLSEPPSPATLSGREWKFKEDDDFV